MLERLNFMPNKANCCHFCSKIINFFGLHPSYSNLYISLKNFPIPFVCFDSGFVTDKNYLTAPEKDFNFFSCLGGFKFAIAPVLPVFVFTPCSKTSFFFQTDFCFLTTCPKSIVLQLLEIFSSSCMSSCFVPCLNKMMSSNQAGVK